MADLAGVDQVAALVMPGLRTSDRSTKRSIDAHPTALQDLTEAVRGTLQNIAETPETVSARAGLLQRL